MPEKIFSASPTWLAYKDRFRLSLLTTTESENAPIVLGGHLLIHREEQLATEMEIVVGVEHGQKRIPSLSIP